jgi:hypothetical protein
MAKEDEKKDAEKEEKVDAAAGTQLDKILSHLDALHARMDAFEEKDEKKDSEKEEKKDAEETIRYFGKGHEKKDSEKDEKEKDDAKMKADAEEKEKKDAEEKACAEKEKADAEMMDKKRKDTEREEREDAKEKEMADAALSQADIRAAIKRLERKIPKDMGDDDYAELAACQSKADSVFHAFGKAAPRPLMNESAAEYRRRTSTELKSYSPKYKSVDLYAIADSNLYDAVEETIYADAMGVAMSPAASIPGSLRPISKSSGGHEFITYVGDPAAWMNEIAGPARNYVTAINTNRSVN